MAEYFFELSQDDQREALEQVRAETGRPTHLLEKDLWVVWTLRALFTSAVATDLTFKGGTSLSKAYKIIDRFSEDIDLTYDIRKLIADLVGSGSDLPTSRSQADKWTKAVRKQAAVPPGNRIRSCPSPAIWRGHLPDVSFPTASPLVMNVARTFWEKATAAHVYCAQGRIRSERYARHWYDLAAIARSQYFPGAIEDRGVAAAVIAHKSFFFIKKGVDGAVIDYGSATGGRLRIVPTGEARKALASDYAAMVADEVMLGDALPFDRLMQACAEVETGVNGTAVSR